MPHHGSTTRELILSIYPCLRMATEHVCTCRQLRHVARRRLLRDWTLHSMPIETSPVDVCCVFNDGSFDRGKVNATIRQDQDSQLASFESFNAHRWLSGVGHSAVSACTALARRECSNCSA